MAENNGTVKMSWALSLMTLIAGSLIATGMALWRAEYSATDTRLDQIWTEIKQDEQQANTDHYRIGQTETAVGGVQQQVSRDQDRLDQQAAQDLSRFDTDERRVDKLEGAMNDLSDAMHRLAINASTRDRKR